MTKITEIAPDTFRISTFLDAANISFGQFLMRDDEPFLYETGQNAIFPEVLAAVKTLIDPATLRWVGFSHFEADESGALGRWLEVAPGARPVTSVLGAATNVGDVTSRKPRTLEDDEVLVTGSHRLRFLITPYVPHSWDATLLYDETTRVLFCSDLFAQHGRLPPLDDGKAVLERSLAGLKSAQDGPFRESIPYTTHTASTFARLAGLEPEILAPMHGSCVKGGDNRALLNDLARGLASIHGADRSWLLSPTGQSS